MSTYYCVKYPLTITAAVIALFVGIAWYFVSRQEDTLSFSEPPPEVQTEHSTLPVRLLIPSLDIDVPITAGTIIDGMWSISDTHASHLVSSAYPGDDGNMILYGHDKRSILGKLPRITVGDGIIVEDTEGNEHRYNVTEIHTVSPNDTDLIQPTDSTVLTVYTCTGFLNSKRFVVRALPD
jgi:sortase A